MLEVMGEKTAKTIKKSLCFEKSGEKLSVEISMDTIISFLDTLFEHAKEDIKN